MPTQVFIDPEARFDTSEHGRKLEVNDSSTTVVLDVRRDVIPSFGDDHVTSSAIYDKICIFVRHTSLDRWFSCPAASRKKDQTRYVLVHSDIIPDVITILSDIHTLVNGSGIDTHLWIICRTENEEKRVSQQINKQPPPAIITRLNENKKEIHDFQNYTNTSIDIADISSVCSSLIEEYAKDKPRSLQSIIHDDIVLFTLYESLSKQNLWSDKHHLRVVNKSFFAATEISGGNESLLNSSTTTTSFMCIDVGYTLKQHGLLTSLDPNHIVSNKIKHSYTKNIILAISNQRSTIGRRIADVSEKENVSEHDVLKRFIRYAEKNSDSDEDKPIKKRGEGKKQNIDVYRSAYRKAFGKKS